MGANSATGLASRPIKVLLADEVDRYPGSAGTEGDPLSLAQKRQTTFWDKKTVMVSTPVIKGHSRIETEYNQSTREEWNVPCPECGHYQPFVWANLIFDPDDLQKEIIYKCERCGCVANEYRWKQQSQQGRFVAENPGAETRGFHLNTLASTFCGWKEIVQKFIVAKEQLDQGKTTRALLTLTERKTRKEIIIAIPNRKAETVVKALDALERKLGARRFRAIFKSITFDNGTEFAAAEELERSCVNKRLPRTKVYFCHPYSSWERGTNENTNGMIRRRFPKGTNFAAVTNAQIAQAENWINNYPRKILGYKSSEIVFRECLRELGIAA